MVAPKNRLADYDEAIESLLEEIRQYQSVNDTLRGMAATLGNIQEINKAAGNTLWTIGTDASKILVSIKDLQLEDMQSRADQHYTSHRAELERLHSEIQVAVHEQQRLGVEMLQRSVASQKEFAAFVKQSEQFGADARDRDLSIEERINTLSSTSANSLNALNQQISGMRIFVLVVIALIVILGVVTYLQ